MLKSALRRRKIYGGCWSGVSRSFSSQSRPVLSVAGKESLALCLKLAYVRNYAGPGRRACGSCICDDETQQAERVVLWWPATDPLFEDGCGQVLVICMPAVSSAKLRDAIMHLLLGCGMTELGPCVRQRYGRFSFLEGWLQCLHVSSKGT